MQMDGKRGLDGSKPRLRWIDGVRNDSKHLVGTEGFYRTPRLGGVLASGMILMTTLLSLTVYVSSYQLVLRLLPLCMSNLKRKETHY